MEKQEFNKEEFDKLEKELFEAQCNAVTLGASFMPITYNYVE